MTTAHDTTLVTGVPLFTARHMVKRLVGAYSTERVYLLVENQDAQQAKEFVGTLGEESISRVTIFVGDVTSMDLGLSGREYESLTKEVTCIHHMAGLYHLGAKREQVQQVNVGGTRGILELALECERLRRFNYWSSARVSGTRSGVVMEDELECGQDFHNDYEHGKYAAEKIVRSLSRRIPSTIFRPGLIVGDSKTGEIGRYDGPYHLMTILMNGPFDVQLPLPGRGEGPLHLVPIDFVIDAADSLARMEHTVSKTFHLVDPCPLSAKSVYELVAMQVHHQPAQRTLPPIIAKTMLRLPWMGKFAGTPKTIMEGFNDSVFYNCRNMLDALRHTDVWCPSFESYVDHLVRFARERLERSRRDDERDPLE